MNGFNKWRRLDDGERLVVAYAAGALALLPALVRWVSLKRLLSSGPLTPAIASFGHATRIAALVDGVALNLPWTTTCLHRAVAAAWLMRRCGCHGELIVGVRKGGDDFAAHAWLEHLGSPLCHTTDGYQRLASWPY